MSEDKAALPIGPEIKTNGFFAEKGILVSERSSIDALSQRGYGTAEKDVLTLTFYEALFKGEGFCSGKDTLSPKHNNLYQMP